MTVSDMHILVNERAQGLGPSRFDDFLKEEIDDALNLAQEKVTKQSFGYQSAVKPLGHEQSEKRIEDLRSILYRENLTTYTIQEGQHWGTKFSAVAAKIPQRLMFMTNMAAKVEQNADCSAVTKNTTLAAPVDYVVVDLPEPSPNYDNFDLWVSYDIQGIQSGLDFSIPTGVTTKEELVAWLTNDEFRRTLPYDIVHLELYWERYKELYYPNQMIIIVKDSGPETAYSALMLNDGTTPLIGDFPVAISGWRSGLESRASLVGGETNVRYPKFIQQDDIGMILKDPFNRPHPQGPIYTVSNDEIVLYESDIFIIPELYLSYIVKPRLISLSLNFNCVLPEYMHEEVVDEAVQHLLSITSNPRVTQQSQDILRHE